MTMWFLAWSLVMLIIFVTISPYSQAPTRIAWFNLLKSVWLRAFRLNRGAHSTLSSFAVKCLFWSFYRETRLASNTWLAAISRSGRRIIQRLEALSTTVSTAIDQTTEAFPVLPGSINSLNLKEFLVPTTLEVGRIIRGFETPSTLNFKKP